MNKYKVIITMAKDSDKSLKEDYEKITTKIKRFFYMIFSGDDNCTIVINKEFGVWTIEWKEEVGFSIFGLDTYANFLVEIRDSKFGDDFSDLIRKIVFIAE